MQSDAPKKKKFRLVKGADDNKDLQSTSVSNSQTRVEFPFPYCFEQLVNLRLAKLLPYSNVRVDLQEGKVYGIERDVKLFLKIIGDDLKSMSGIVLQLKEHYQIDDVEYQAAEFDKTEVIRPKIIQRSLSSYFEDTCFWEQYENFIQLFQNQQKLLCYLRVPKISQEDLLHQIKDFATVRVKAQERKKFRGNRMQLKTVIFQEQYSNIVFNAQDFKSFIRKCDQLELKQVQIIEKKNVYGKITSYVIKLSSYQPKEADAKLKPIRFYFQYESIFELPIEDSAQKQSLCKKYGNVEKKEITIKLVQGYKSSKWEDKDLLYKIRTKGISKKKTNYTNVYFQALHLKGLRNIVFQYQKQLNEALHDVPMDDLTVEVFLDFKEVQDYIRGNKDLRGMIEVKIYSFMKDYQKICLVEDVTFPLGGVKVGLVMKAEKEKQFNVIVKEIMEKSLTKEVVMIKCDIQFRIDDFMLKRLKQENLLVLSHDETQLYLAEVKEKVATSTQRAHEILKQRHQFDHRVIRVKGGAKLYKLEKQIEKLRKEKEFDQILGGQGLPKDSINYEINLYGPIKIMEKFMEQLEPKKTEIDLSICQYVEIISQNQGNLLIQDKKSIEKLLQESKISILVNQNKQIDVKLQLRAKLAPKTIYIRKGRSLEIAPINSLIIFNDKSEVEELKEPYLSLFKTKAKRWSKGILLDAEEARNFILVIYDVQDVAYKMKDAYKNHKFLGLRSIVLMMPKQKKTQFVRNVIDSLLIDPIYSQSELTVTILEGNMEQNLEDIVKIEAYSTAKAPKEEFSVNWSCVKPYSQSGNDKINDAIASGLSWVYLQAEHVQKPLEYSHICDLDKKIIYNSKSPTVQVPLDIKKGQISYTINNQRFKIPQDVTQKIELYHFQGMSRLSLSLTLYLIDLVNFRQINAFTGKSRPLIREQIKLQKKEIMDEVRAFYKLKVTEMVLTFEQSQAKLLKSSLQKIYDLFNEKMINEQIKFGNVMASQAFLDRIGMRAQQNNLEYNLDSFNKKITIKSYDRKDVERFKKIMKLQIEFMSTSSDKSTVIYPKEWVPQQQDIQIFAVDPASPQFSEVQKLFTLTQIYRLTRIQNKTMYRNYYEELMSLKYQNGGIIPKEMQLFHGTHLTVPSLIYEDKEDGFNVNYSSDSNLLGRGIYFAVKSQYSMTYKYDEKMVYMGRRVFSMFLCSVIVGDSQDMIMSGMNKGVINTNFKDAKKGIRYQSMRGKHQICDIYVVYRNRRAYPLYLIQFAI